MKYIMLALVLSGCATRDYKQISDQVAEYGLQSYEDKKHSVVCYMYRDGDFSSLSCVKK